MTRLPAQNRDYDETYRVEFEYDYGPHLLPTQPLSDEGMWRYHSLLPLHYVERLYPLAVGNTPLVAPHILRQLLNLPSLWIKDETRSPTGSNKDRATALILEDALHKGIQTICCASTGNVAVSLAVGAAATGKKAVIFVPDNVSDTKLQIMRMAGATIFKVIEGYEAAMQLSRRAAYTFGWCDRNTGYNPLTIEAKKTVALEIWEQLGHQIPDVVCIPVGDGVTFSGIAKGFRELKLCGATSKLPRLIGIQATGCQPLKIAWERNEEMHPIQPATIADGIAVGFPTYGTVTLRNIREYAGDTNTS
jgi:threonine synthase